MAESVDGTSNDTVGSTANGKRSRSDSAGGGDHGLPRLRLTEDQAAADGTAPRLMRETTRAGKRLAAGESVGTEGYFPLSLPGGRATPGE